MCLFGVYVCMFVCVCVCLCLYVWMRACMRAYVRVCARVRASVFGVVSYFKTFVKCHVFRLKTCSKALTTSNM